jgi:hypothetical protein
VDVDQLDVKLVVVMFYFGEIFFGEWVAGEFLEVLFALVEFIALSAESVYPGVTLPGKLRDVCLNHGIYI